MWNTQDEAVVMFARYCRARFGETASQQVRAKAEKLKKRGDIEGYDIWNKVAAEIENGTKSRCPPAFAPILASAADAVTAHQADDAHQSQPIAFETPQPQLASRLLFPL